MGGRSWAHKEWNKKNERQAILAGDTLLSVHLGGKRDLSFRLPGFDLFLGRLGGFQGLGFRVETRLVLAEGRGRNV